MDPLYPIDIATHPQPGDLSAYRDGLFGRQPPLPYGEQDGSFANGIFGPGLGTVTDGSILDNPGSLTAFRDGVFNFAREAQQQQDPLVSYRDGIFGGASLGMMGAAETPTSIDMMTPSSSDSTSMVNAPAGTVVLDLNDPGTVNEVMAYIQECLALASGGAKAAMPPVAAWNEDSSALAKSMAEFLLASGGTPETASVVKQGGLYFPTGASLVALSLYAGSNGSVGDPAVYPRVIAFLSGCFTAMSQNQDPERGCPIIYPQKGISRAMMYGGGAALGLGLLYVLFRKK